MGSKDKLQTKEGEVRCAAREALGTATGHEEMEREGKTDRTKSNLK